MPTNDDRSPKDGPRSGTDAEPSEGGGYEGVHVALVGVGNWGRHILRDLRALGVEVTAVARGDESVARANDGGATAVIDDVARLAGRGIDGVVVATPTVTHADVVDAVLDLGVPMFVEKPLTPDLASARRLRERAGERLFVMDKWRYHGAIEALGEIARSGRFGALQGLVSARHQWGNPHDDVDAVWILAPHDLSIAVEILGFLPEPVHAVADRVGGEVTGLRALLGRDPWHALSISARAPVWDRTVQVVTEGATLVLHDSYDDHVCAYPTAGLTFGDPPEPERIPVSTAFPLARELEAFVHHLVGGPPPKADAADAVATVECIEALRVLAGIDG